MSSFKWDSPEQNYIWLITLYLSILLAPVLFFFVLIPIVFLTMYKKTNININYWPEKYFLFFSIITIMSWLYNPTWLDFLIVWDSNFGWVPTLILPLIMFFFYFFTTVWFRNIGKFTWRQIMRVYLLFWLAGLFIPLIIFIQWLDWKFGIKLYGFNWLLDFYELFRNQDWSVRSIGTSGNSNSVGGLLICLCQINIYALFVLRGYKYKLFSLATLIIYLLAMNITGSRGAWVGLIIGLVVQIWMTGYRKLVVSLTLFIVAVINIFPSIIPRSDSLKHTVKDRFEIWSNSLAIFSDNWLFGTLPINFSHVYKEKFGKFMINAHNNFLGIATEFGIIGFILFVFFAFLTIKRAREWRKTANQIGEKRLSGMLLAQYIAILIGHGLYDYPIITPQIGLLFILSCIIIHVQHNNRCLTKLHWNK